MSSDPFLEALLSLPTLYDARVSPDGRWVGWTWYRTGPTADVYAAPTDGSSPPLRLTDTPQDTTLVSWTLDGHSVLVSQDRDGDERFRLFRVDLPAPSGLSARTGGRPGEKPGVLHPLTEAAPHFFLRGGQLHPNHRWLIYAANWDASAEQEIEPSWLYRHDLESGQQLPLARPARGCHYLPDLNDQGTHILYQRCDLHPAGRQVWLVDVDGRHDREIVNAGPDKKASASWLPDGRRALVLAETETHQRVGLYDCPTGELSWLLDDPDRNIEAAYVPRGSHQAVIIEIRQARIRASLLDLESGDETPVPATQGDLIPLAPVGPGEWVGEYYSSQQPADLVRFSLPEPLQMPPLSVARVWERTTLSPYDLVAAEDMRWRAADGLEIQGWLYRTRGEPQGTVVYVHGGPTSHSQDRVNVQIQFLVSRGFNVLDPNYRGSTGFGRAFRQAIKTEGWGGQEQEDIRAGIEALIAAGIAQPGKVGITGTSYGGYSAWWAATHFPPRIVAAAAPICGMTDLVVDYHTTRPDLRPLSEDMMGGSPSQVPARYRDRSPVHLVQNIRVPLLIVQGLQDPNVTPENTYVVRTALEQAGVPYELLAFQDEGHGIARPANHRILYARLADFFAAAFRAG